MRRIARGVHSVVSKALGSFLVTEFPRLNVERGVTNAKTRADDNARARRLAPHSVSSGVARNASSGISAPNVTHW